MIPHSQTCTSISNLPNPQHQYTIEMTAPMAKLLSSLTYTDKLLAAIREPLSNAYDAHVRAGKRATAADLHLPTHLEPWFSIRDYGTGLSHDDVVRLFFSYGVSDKRHTNQELGGLGIGAKAFFAYADQAIITSWHGGQRLNFVASRSAAGLPQGTLVSAHPTDEPVGLEVRFPVQAGDMTKVREHVEQLLVHLPLKHTTNVELNIKPPAIDLTLDVLGHRVDIAAGSSSGYCIHYVVMGGLAYKLDEKFYNKARQTYTNHYSMPAPWMLSATFHLPIGTVEISASREALSPTPADETLLVKLYTALFDALRAYDWQARLDAHDSWFGKLQAKRFIDALGHTLTNGVMDRQPPSLYGAQVYEPSPNVQTLAIKQKSGRRVAAYRVEAHALRAEHVLNLHLRNVWWSTHAHSVARAYEDPDHGPSYFDSRDQYDLRIVAPDEATARAELQRIGLNAELHDDSGYQNPKKQSRAKASRPRVTGRVWINAGSASTDIDKLIEQHLILGPDRHSHPHDWNYVTHIWCSRGAIRVTPTVIYPYGGKTKGYEHLPTTTTAWIEQHPEFVNSERLTQCHIAALVEERMRQLADFPLFLNEVTLNRAVEHGGMPTLFPDLFRLVSTSAALQCSQDSPLHPHLGLSLYDVDGYMAELEAWVQNVWPTLSKLKQEAIKREHLCSYEILEYLEEAA